MADELTPALQETMALFKGRRQLMIPDVAEKLNITESAARNRLARLYWLGKLDKAKTRAYVFYTAIR